MKVLAFLAFLAALTGAQRLRNRNGNLSQNIQVISAEPRNGTIIRQGDSVRLSCRTNIQWFFCVWKGPGGKKQCAIQERMPQNVCQGDNRITLQGGSNNCDIILKDVKSEDFGNWMCLVTDPVKFNSDKQKIALEVGSPANVKFQRSYGKKNTLVITEGEETEVRFSSLDNLYFTRLARPLDRGVGMCSIYWTVKWTMEKLKKGTTEKICFNFPSQVNLTFVQHLVTFFNISALLFRQ